jgi:hypothetical protein
MNDDADFSPTTLLQGTPDGQAARARRPNHKLTEPQKDYVIRRLAAYDTPTEIQRDLREKFGVEITRQAIETYDPTRRPDCGKQSADVFFGARGALLQSEPDAPLSLRKDELRRRERLVLRSLETLADRILKSIDAGNGDVFAKRADRISDDDRLRALQSFADRLKTTNPAGFAALRTTLLGETPGEPPDPPPEAARHDPDEAPHAE